MIRSENNISFRCLQKRFKNIRMPANFRTNGFVDFEDKGEVFRKIGNYKSTLNFVNFFFSH